MQSLPATSPPVDRVSPRGLGILVAWGLLDATLGIYLFQNGLSVTTSFLLMASAVLVAVALLGRGQPTSAVSVERLAVALIVMQAATLSVLPYRQIGSSPPVTIHLLAAVGLLAVVVGVVVRRWEVGLGIAAAAAIAARLVVVAGDIPPTFDVPFIQAAAGQALLNGSNPYLTHIYIEGYPYWPMSAIAAALGLLAGDARWASVAADVITAGSLVVIGRSMWPGTRVGLALAVLWLWSLAGLFITWQGFPEPIVVATVALAVVALVRPRPLPVLAGVFIGLAIATKQFGLGLIPFLPFSGRTMRWRTLPAALIGAAAWIAPFWLWRPDAFVHGSIVSLLDAPGRAFSLNLLEPLPGVLPRLHVAFAAAAALGLILGGLVQWRWQSPVASWLAGTAMFLLTVFLLNEIGFVNYYQLVLGLLALVVLVPEDWPTMAAPDDGMTLAPER